MPSTKRATLFGFVRRFRVVDRSMEPTLREGEGLVGIRSGRVRVGELRVFEHPHHRGFWLVKRVEEARPDGRMVVRSDNDAAATSDSRLFGAVAVAGSYRVVLVVAPSPREGPAIRRPR